MSLETLLPVLMFPVLLMFLLSGYPVAFVLSGVALGFALIGSYLEVFYWTDLGFIPARIFGIVSNFTLVAVPLFVFMGLTLERSGIAKDLLVSVNDLFKGRKSGLALTVIMVGALLAASTGIVGATVVTMGVISLPTMLKSGYSKSLSCGTIAASGTLGQIIPPSIVLIILGDMMNVDVGDLFAGALLPGLILVGMYMSFVLIRSIVQPAAFGETNRNSRDRPISAILASFVGPFALIILVLGSILGGIASPTEAAGCGALGALLIALIKKRINWRDSLAIGSETALTTSMVFMIMVGAQFFGVVFRGLGGDDLIADFINDFQLSSGLVLLAIMVMLFILGFFLDFLEICFIVIPIIQPLLVQLGYDPLWIAILIAVNLQTSFLTPPFGFALFYLKGVAPKEVSTGDIYRGVIPFVAIQITAMVVLYLFPQIALWLPKQIF